MNMVRPLVSFLFSKVLFLQVWNSNIGSSLFYIASEHCFRSMKLGKQRETSIETRCENICHHIQHPICSSSPLLISASLAIFFCKNNLQKFHTSWFQKEILAKFKCAIKDFIRLVFQRRFWNIFLACCNHLPCCTMNVF